MSIPGKIRKYSLYLSHENRKLQIHLCRRCIIPVNLVSINLKLLVSSGCPPAGFRAVKVWLGIGAIVYAEW